MSLSNPMYGTLPAFQRPASTGPNVGGVTGGAFIPPPPGASIGGEPGHYTPFQQSHSRVLSWPNTQTSQPQFQSQSHAPSHSSWASSYTHSQQSRQSQYSQPTQPQSRSSQPSPYLPQHSPFYPPQNSPYQPHPSQRAQHHAQQPDPSSLPWTYGQYPPSPNYPFTTPVTIAGFNTPNTPNSTSRYRHLPPHSAPPEAAPWSRHSRQSRSHDYNPHQPNHSQQHFNQHHDQSHARRPTHERHHSSNSLGSVPLIDEDYHQPLPLPFSGSANAPAPKKSALKRSYSQSAAVERQTTSRSQPHTPRIQQNDSTRSGLGAGVNGTGWSIGPSPAVYPTTIPVSPPVIPQIPHPYVPGYALPDEEAWTSDNHSPRPRDWRADYAPKQGISLYLSRIGRVRSDVEEYTDTVKRDLHPVLHHAPESEPLTFDLRYQIIEGHTLTFAQNEIDLAQLAAFPPAPILRLYHPKLPWYIDIHQSHPTGVTVFDVLAQMSLQMQAPIHNRHYYNDVLDSADRVALGRAYKERCSGRSVESRKGVLQVDFLGGKYVFEGLARGKQGMWEIRSRLAENPPTR